MPCWDLFCRVVDNFGDLGVCWRLARQLASDHGIDVRLWVDDLNSFARLAPTLNPSLDRQRLGAIDVIRWESSAAINFAQLPPSEAVIEAFACELPHAFLDAMERWNPQPRWINLEYLTAEPWIESCHGLPSPQAGRSISKHFFFPGFTIRTGGLLREAGLRANRSAFSREEFWPSIGLTPPDDDALCISLFCYENAALPELLEIWRHGAQQVQLCLTPGPATKTAAETLSLKLCEGARHHCGSLEIVVLPFLSHADYDRLLWACDLNFVRGEDSFVRAQWAEQPFVWHIYPQDGNAHAVKLEALLDRYLTGVEPEFAAAVRRFWQCWNGLAPAADSLAAAWTEFASRRTDLRRLAVDWTFRLDPAGNLTDNLVRFVRGNG